MKYILTHGFNVSDYGAGSINKLQHFIPGSTLFKYGWVGILGVYLWNKGHARELANSISEPTVIIGHSNGALLANMASHLNPLIKGLVFINPAMDAEILSAPSVEKISVWYSPSDSAVKAAEWIPFHQWGNMGSTGAINLDHRYTNYNKEDDYLLSSKEHSDVFGQPLLSYFGPLIAESAILGD